MWTRKPKKRSSSSRVARQVRGAQVVVVVGAASSPRDDVVDAVGSGLAAEPADAAVAGQDGGALALVAPAQAALGGGAPRGVAGALTGRAELGGRGAEGGPAAGTGSAEGGHQRVSRAVLRQRFSIKRWSTGALRVLPSAPECSVALNSWIFKG